MDIVAGIYQIRNRISGKHYIGSAVNIERRWRDHLNQLRRQEHPNPHLQHAFDNYGEAGFIFSVLESIQGSGQLIIREQYYLDMLKPEYNIALGAGSPMLGRHHTPETRVKIAISQSGEGNPFYGKRHSFEARMKMSTALMGHPVSDETKRKISKAHKGKRFTKEHRANISKSKRGERNPNFGKRFSVERRRRMSEAQKGKRHSAETRAKLSAIRKAYWRRGRLSKGATSA